MFVLEDQVFKYQMVEVDGCYWQFQKSWGWLTFATLEELLLDQEDIPLSRVWLDAWQVISPVGPGFCMVMR